MIKLDNVVFNYQSMPMVFDLQIQAQEKVAIIGESGAGKSTLLNLIAGFEQAASAVNLQDFLTRKPTALSGGQKQRVALARCLLRDKPILLLDEPFSALDPKLRIEMQDLMDQLCEEKKLTMLLVTHQPKEIERHIDRVIEIHQGKVI